MSNPHVPFKTMADPRVCPVCLKPATIERYGLDTEGGANLKHYGFNDTAVYAVLSCGCTTRDTKWINSAIDRPGVSVDSGVNSRVRERVMPPTLTDQIRDMLKLQPKSRYAIAKSTGIDKASLSRFARGKRNLSPHNLDLLAAYLGVVVATQGETDAAS